MSLHRDSVAFYGLGKSPGVVGFRDLGLTVLDLWPGVSLPVLGWAIA